MATILSKWRFSFSDVMTGYLSQIWANATCADSSAHWQCYKHPPLGCKASDPGCVPGEFLLDAPGIFSDEVLQWGAKSRRQAALQWCAVSYTADSRLAPSQWETSLQSNAVSYWLGANMESALAWSLTSLDCLITYSIEQQRKHQSPTLPALCVVNPSVIGGFPSQRASNVESVSMSSHPHALCYICAMIILTRG